MKKPEKDDLNLDREQFENMKATSNNNVASLSKDNKYHHQQARSFSQTRYNQILSNNIKKKDCKIDISVSIIGKGIIAGLEDISKDIFNCNQVSKH